MDDHKDTNTQDELTKGSLYEDKMHLEEKKSLPNGETFPLNNAYDGAPEGNDKANLMESLGQKDFETAEDSDMCGDEDSCCYVPKRYVIVCLLSLGMFIANAMRINLAVTVVTILDKNPDIMGTDTAIANLPKVHWSALDVGLLHSVFYMGYLVTQIPGGYLATKLPSHRLFGACILVSGAFNMLLPVTIGEGSYPLTCLVRVIQGLAEGLLYPTCYAVMGHWTTPSERSWLGSIVLTGVYLGPMVGLAVSGALTYYAGWQYVFYVHSIGVVIWFVFWLFFAYEKPGNHPKINTIELRLIEREQGETAVLYKNSEIPWREIFTSLPVHALNVCNFARNWVFYLLLTNEPTYINMFGFHMAQNGVLSALPHGLMVIIVISSGPIADLLVFRTQLSRTHVRKVFTGIGFGWEGMCFIILGVLTSGIPAVTILTLGIGISGLTVSGWQINHLDLAPRYAGVLVAISTTVGTIAAIIIPLITGYLTRDMTMEGWHNVFFLTATILVIAVIFYSIFGSGDIQPWATPLGHEVIVNQKGPMENGLQPYGTFSAQIDHDQEKYTPPDVADNARRRLTQSQSSLQSRDSDVTGSEKSDSQSPS